MANLVDSTRTKLTVDEIATIAAENNGAAIHPRAIIEGLKADEKSASAIAGRVQNVLTYGKEHYNGEFTSEETLKNVSLQDVINHYNSYF